MLQGAEFITPCRDNFTHTPTQMRTDTQHDELLPLGLPRQSPSASGRR